MGIADELITRGWTQHTYEDEKTGAVCLYGAAWKASGIKTLDEWEASYTPQEKALVRAAKLVDPDTIGAADYNDFTGRTFDDVLRVAKIADEILDGMVQP